MTPRHEQAKNKESVKKDTFADYVLRIFYLKELTDEISAWRSLNDFIVKPMCFVGNLLTVFF